MSTTDRPTVDPRGPQFAAALTAVVLAASLAVLPGSVGFALLALQTVLFGIGAALGVTRTPHAWLFRRLVRPRLAPPAHLEDAAPPRFAQTVGFAFAVTGLVAWALGWHAVAAVAVGFALAAALLNALFGFCLGCEVYLLFKRLTIRPATN
jgi:flagellar biosynthesis protein FliR